jgi:hypothetical protein
MASLVRTLNSNRFGGSSSSFSASNNGSTYKRPQHQAFGKRARPFRASMVQCESSSNNNSSNSKKAEITKLVTYPFMQVSEFLIII